jgi:hypothetical protein
MVARSLLLVGMVLLTSCSAANNVSTTLPKKEATLAQKSGFTFAIQNTQGKHLGFLLMVGSASGDCIFRSLPTEANNFETPESEHLYQLQTYGEFSWSKKQNNEFEIFNQEGNKVAWINGTELKTNKFTFKVVDASEK